MTTPQSNGITFQHLMTSAAELGGIAGKAKDGQVKWLRLVMEAAFQGNIDLVASKHGTDLDDATVLTEGYVKANDANTIFNAKAGNQRKAISCTRTMIKLGQWPKGGSGEPLFTVNKFITMWLNARKDPAKAKRLDDAANALLKYARVQLKEDHVIDDTRLESLLWKREPDLKSTEEYLVAMRDGLLKLKHGKAAKGNAMDNSTQVNDAIALLTARVVELVKIKSGNVPAAAPVTAPVTLAAAATV